LNFKFIINDFNKQMYFSYNWIVEFIKIDLNKEKNNIKHFLRNQIALN
ncbi:unnamed protein product, partial [marine sediment metagenome]